MTKITVDYLRKLVVEQLAFAHENAKNVFAEELGILKEEEPPGGLEEVTFNSLSAIDFFLKDGERSSLEEQGEVTFRISRASEPAEEIVQDFFDSLYGGKRSGFLTYYSNEDLASMNLFLVDGHNAGFAIKTDGDIVSVHNNSSLRGLSSVFMNEAKAQGGTKLDHFDGFLTGLYRKYGFNDVYQIYQWEEQYKPKGWNYDTIELLNPRHSVYAEALLKMYPEAKDEPRSSLPNEEVEVIAESGVKELINPNLKYNQYLYGRPDVIFRKL